jgi:hypothetical protein
MESYFNQELITAISLAAVFWVGLFIFESAYGSRGTGLYLITGIFAIILLSVIGLVSSYAALILSIAAHTFLFLFQLYGLICCFAVEMRKK